MACCVYPQCPNPDSPQGCPDAGDPQRPCVVPQLLKQRFEVKQFLGQGGFGRTYRGVDISNQLPCVIKQLVPQGQGTWAANKAKELFDQEADLLRKLGVHPQIPGLMDSFEEQGYFYLVQEYIEGLTLKQDLKQQKQQRFSEAQVREGLKSLLGVLAYYHGLGVVHRDIKPDNIMVRQSKADNLKPFNGQWVLIDFGVSKKLAGSIMARPGTAIGSLGYAPYEQIQKGEADYSCDLYSLGITGVELLTGRDPYELHLKYGYSWVAEWRKRVPGLRDQTLGAVLDRMLRLKGDYGRGDRSQGGAARALRDLQAKTTVISNPPNPWTRRSILGVLGLGGAVLLARLLDNPGTVTGDPAPGDGFPSPEAIPGDTPAPEPPPPVEPSPLPEPTPEGAVAGLRSETVAVEGVTGLDTFASGGRRESITVTRWVEDLGGGVSLPLVQIPAGDFLMGSPDGEVDRSSAEGPQHRVNFPREFWMGQYEITQGQYQAMMGNNPATQYDSRFVDPNKPVINVSWDDAVAFCQRLSQRTGRNYRLPTEAEWEYACRAGTQTPFAFGETITPDLVNYNGDYPYGNAPKGEYRQKTTVVGEFPANAWGLYDMHGNLWEWCLDQYTENYNWKDSNHPASNDGSIILPYSNNNRVLRGGSWGNDARGCRSAYRDGRLRDLSDSLRGFRVLLSSRTS